MRANYRSLLDGSTDTIEYTVIVPQPMQHGDGFTLLGFDSWEDVHEEKLSGATTNVGEFKLFRDRTGFHENKN